MQARKRREETEAEKSIAEVKSHKNTTNVGESLVGLSRTKNLHLTMIISKGTETGNQ